MLSDLEVEEGGDIGEKSFANNVEDDMKDDAGIIDCIGRIAMLFYLSVVVLIMTVVLVCRGL